MSAPAATAQRAPSSAAPAPARARVRSIARPAAPSLATGSVRRLAAALACLIAAHAASADSDRAAPHGTAPAAALPLSLPRDVDRDGVEDGSDACPRSGRGVRVDAHGCVTFDLAPGAIRFRPGSAWLDPAAERALAGALRTLQRFPGLRFEIRAHADPTAGEARGLEMSLQRARAVSRWFAERGVGAERSDLVAIAARRSAATADGRSASGPPRSVELLPRR